MDWTAARSLLQDVVVEGFSELDPSTATPRAVTYSPAAGGAPMIITRAVFRDESTGGEGFEGDVRPIDEGPRLAIKLEDLGATIPGPGDFLTYQPPGSSELQRYRVQESIEDGEGLADLVLVEVRDL